MRSSKFLPPLLCVIAGAVLAQAPSDKATSAAGELRFTDVSDQAALTPTGFHALGVADLDGDGVPDLICGGWPIRQDLYQARLYRNEGKFRFSDRTPAGWKENRASASGVAVGDVDNDGKIDFFLCAVVGNMNPGGTERRGALFLNEGGFKFREATGQAMPLAGPMLNGRWRSAAFVDIDNDGLLDLLVAGMTIEGKETRKRGTRVLNSGNT